MSEHPDALESLNLATAAGDLPRAYAVLKALDAAEANRVLLRAGFAVYGPNSRLFWIFASNRYSRRARGG